MQSDANRYMIRDQMQDFQSALLLRLSWLLLYVLNLLESLFRFLKELCVFMYAGT